MPLSTATRRLLMQRVPGQASASPLVAGLFALTVAALGATPQRLQAAPRPSPVTYLGPPVNIVSTDSYFPLDDFRHITTDLRSRARPELVFLAAQGTGPFFDQINAERWPLVKALDQFGTLSGVRLVERSCATGHARVPNGDVCSVPTFDLSRAHYASRYLSFVSKDLIRVDLRGTVHAFQRPSPLEWELFTRYAAPQGPCSVIIRKRRKVTTGPCASYAQRVQAALGPRNGDRGLPLTAIGNYLQTSSQIILGGDFQQAVPVVPPSVNPASGLATERGLPFATVREALIRGHDPFPGSHLVEDVNAEADIITTLICHADHLQPRSVCSRSAIRSILKHVK